MTRLREQLGGWKEFGRRLKPGQYAKLPGVGAVQKMADGRLNFIVQKDMRITFHDPDGSEAGAVDEADTIRLAG